MDLPTKIMDENTIIRIDEETHGIMLQAFSGGLAHLEKFQVVKQKGGTQSAWNLAVEKVKETITDQSWSYPRWCKHLKGIPAHEITSKLSTASRSNNVGKTFNGLIKNYKKAMR